MKTILIIFSFLFLLSCEKDDNETADTIVSGRIVQDCNGTPLANKNIEAWVRLSGTCSSLTGCTDLLYTTTDADGNFSFKTKKGSMEIRLKGSNTILYGIPILDNINLGTFNAFPTTSFVYRIKVNNPYNVGDTLVANVEGLLSSANVNQPLHIIAAPFNDTTFSVVTNYGERDSPTYQNIGSVNVKMEYGVVNANHDFYFEKTGLVFSIKSCSSVLDTITLVVD